MDTLKTLRRRHGHPQNCAEASWFLLFCDMGAGLDSFLNSRYSRVDFRSHVGSFYCIPSGRQIAELQLL